MQVKYFVRGVFVTVAVLAIAACENGKHDANNASTGNDNTQKESLADKNEPVRPPLDPYPSTYKPYPSDATIIVGATILTGAGERINNGAIVFDNGKITAVGEAGSVATPEGAIVIDASGKFVTPGIIDVHSHLGSSPSPSAASTSDTNEPTNPNTSGVWAEHSVWPHDAGFSRALAGGVTSLQILPGSANLFGGRSVVLKNVPARSVQGMKFPGAPYGLKMACGENPKNLYKNKGGPATRMANFEGYRKGWIEAAGYRKKWEDYWRKYEAWANDNGAGKDRPGAPSRNLKLETMAGVLSGDIRVNMHCYRADEMLQVLDMAKEFDYKVASFHHAVEAYKIADILAENGVCAAMWPDWWGFKLEAFDGIPENAALVHAQKGGCAIMHSDQAISIQRLNHEAAKAMASGVNIGVDIKPETAISWITLNAATALGIEQETGSLTVGKMADVVLWNGNPFSVYSQTEQVYIDGALMFDRNDPALSPRTDFEIGQVSNDFTGGAGQ